MTKIEIPLSRVKILIAIIRCLISSAILIPFVIIGSRLLPYLPSEFKDLSGLFSFLAYVIAIITGLNCVTLVWCCLKLFDKKPGLVIDESGIYNNSRRNTIKFVPWSHITQITTKQKIFSRMLVITTKNIGEISLSQKFNLPFGKINNSNKKSIIIAKTLKIKFEDLEKLVRDGWEESKRVQEINDKII